MKSKIVNCEGEITHVVVFDSGDEAARGLKEFAKKHRIGAGRVSGVGAFETVTLGFFEWEKKAYKEIVVDEQTEVLSFDGDIALKEDEPEPHVHVVVGKADGTTLGGHLMSGIVRPTLEVVIVESHAELRRRHDPETGLALIDLG